MRKVSRTEDQNVSFNLRSAMVVESTDDEKGHYKYIHKQNGKWVVVQKGTGKVLSTHDSEDDAIASFKAMMVHKHGSVVTAWIPPIGTEWMPNKDNGWLTSIHDENSGVEVHPGGSWRVIGPGHHHDAWRGDMSIYHEGESLDLDEAKKDAVEHFKKITAPGAEYPWDSSKVVRPYPWHEYPSLVAPSLHHLPEPNFLTEKEFEGQKGKGGYPSTYLGSKTAGAWPSETDWEGHLRNLEELLAETQKGVGWHAAKGEKKEMKAHDKLAKNLQKVIDDIKDVMKFPAAKTASTKEAIDLSPFAQGIGQGLGDVVKAVGHGVATGVGDAARAVGHGVTDVVRGIGHAGDDVAEKSGLGRDIGEGVAGLGGAAGVAKGVGMAINKHIDETGSRSEIRRKNRFLERHPIIDKFSSFDERYSSESNWRDEHSNLDSDW